MALPKTVATSGAGEMLMGGCVVESVLAGDGGHERDVDSGERPHDYRDARLSFGSPLAP